MTNQPFQPKQIYANLSRRTTKFLQGFDDLIYSAVKPIYNQLSENSILTEIKITLPIQENYRFKKNVDKALTRIASRQGFNKTLVPSENGENNADIRIVVAKLSGEIIRYYRRGEYLEENSGSQQRNGLQRNRALRSMASIAKIPAAVLLASLGDKATGSLYCNKAYQALQNSSGSQGVTNCDKHQAWHTPLETFGASMNLPLRYALAEKKQTKDELMQLYQAFGIYHPSQFKTTVTAENLIHGLSFGTAEATPMQMHRIIHEIKGEIYTFTILVGAKAGDGDGLAYKVSHSSLMMPIMREIVRSLRF